MILLTGATGLLGSPVAGYLAEHEIDFVATTHISPVPSSIRSLRMELTSSDSIREAVETGHPDWILHCAAMTNVDFCEQNRELATEVNVVATRELAKAAESIGARFLYISTDAVFDGEGGDYTEDDIPNPKNHYARTKLSAEREVHANCSRAVILRTNMFGWGPGRSRGLAEWGVAKFREGSQFPGFIDCFFNPPFTRTLAAWIVAIMQANLAGLFHLGTSDFVSKWEFFRRIAEELGFDPALVSPSKMDSIQFVAPRPRDTVLNATKLAGALGLELPSVNDEIKRFRQFGAERQLERLTSQVGLGANAE